MKYKSDGVSYMLDCPSCKGKDKMEVHPDGRYHCHKCKRGGKKNTKLGLREQQFTLRSVKFRRIPETHGQWKKLAAERVSELGRAEYEKLNPMKCDQLDCVWHVFFPFYEGGTIIQAQGYLPGGLKNYRYWNPPLNWFVRRKSECLWGTHLLSYPIKRLVLVEGIFDALWGDNRLALMGSSISRSQVELIRELRPEKVVVMLDGDARLKAVQIAMVLDFTKVDVAFLPWEKDPDNLKGEGEKYIETAERFR